MDEQASNANPPSPLFPDGTDDLVASLLSQYNVASLSVGIVDNDRSGTRASPSAYGHAQLPSIPATEDTLYYIASCTKSFTAITTKRQLSQLNGTVTLQTPLKSILPPGDFELAEGPYATERATLEDALTHRLGTASHNLNYGGRADYTVRDAVRSLRHLTPAFGFREKYHYLNLGYMTAQYAVETLAGGKPIETLHARYIWDPLGMESTFPSLATARAAAGSRLAKGYTRASADSSKVIVAPYVDDYPLIGGGGLISSIKDMTRYAAAVLHNHFPALGDKDHEDLFVPRVVVDESPREGWSTGTYALGWRVETFHGHRVVYHDGGICGFGSRVLLLPAQRWAAVLLSNSDTGGLAVIGTVALRLLRQRLGLPEGDEGPETFTRWDKGLQEHIKNTATARERLYPQTDRPRTPLSLPLEAYEGTYEDPGYGQITLRQTQDTDNVPCREKIESLLHAEWPGRLMDFIFDLEHVTGDAFVVWMDTATSNVGVRCGQRGTFLVRDGKIESMGINMSGGNADDDKLMVWFRRVDKGSM